MADISPTECPTCHNRIDQVQNDCCIAACTLFSDKYFVRKPPPPARVKPEYKAVKVEKGPRRQSVSNETRASATLPELLDIKVVNVGEHTIISRCGIPARAMFGPLIGAMQNPEPSVMARFSLRTIGIDGQPKYKDFNLDSDNACNWMKLVHLSNKEDGYNLTAFQYDDKIFFVSVRDIKPGEELKVSYADNYSQMIVDRLMSMIGTEGDGANGAGEAANGVDAASGVSVEQTAETVASMEIANEAAGGAQQEILEEATEATHEQEPAVAEAVVEEAPAKAVQQPIEAPVSRKRKTKQPAEGPSETRKSRRTRKGAAQANETLSASEPLRDLAAIASLVGAMDAVTGTEIASFKCGHCPATFDDRTEMISHVILHQQQPPEKESTVSRNECFYCHEKMATSKLAAHYNENHRVNGFFPCPGCDKTFDSVMKLREHSRVKHGDKQHACEVCGYTTTNKSHFNRHLATHMEGQIQCPHCPMKLRTTQNLRYHIRGYHTVTPGESEQVTDESDEESPKKSKKKPVMQLKGPDFYKCRDCQLTFKQRNSLLTHLDTRHPELDRSTVPELKIPFQNVVGYSCARCPRRYATAQLAKSHVAEKHPDVALEADQEEKVVKKRIYSLPWCEACDKPLESPRQYLAHLKKDHPNTYEAITPEDGWNVDASFAE